MFKAGVAGTSVVVFFSCSHLKSVVVAQNRVWIIEDYTMHSVIPHNLHGSK